MKTQIFLIQEEIKQHQQSLKSKEQTCTFIKQDSTKLLNVAEKELLSEGISPSTIVSIIDKLVESSWSAVFFEYGWTP